MEHLLSFLKSLECSGGDEFFSRFVCRNIRDFIFSSPDTAVALLEAALTLEESVQKKIVTRVFEDVFLAELILRRYEGSNPALRRLAELTKNSGPAREILTVFSEGQVWYMHALVRPLLFSMSEFDEKIIELLRRQENKEPCIIRSVAARILLAAGDIDRGLKNWLGAPEYRPSPLLYFEAYELTLDSRYLKLAKLAAEEDETVTARLILRLSELLEGNQVRLSEAEREALYRIKFRDKLDETVKTRLSEKVTDELLELADILMELSLDGASAMCLRRLLMSAGSNLDGLLRLSEIHEKKGNPEYALRILEIIEKEVPGEVNIKRRIVENLKTLERTREAIEKLKEIIELEPGDVIALTELVSLISKVEGDEAALPVARKLVTMDPRNITALRIIARTASHDEMEEAWMKVLAVRADDVEARGMIRKIKDAERTKMSEELKRKAIEFAQKGDYDRAIRDLKELVELNPDYYHGHLALAGLYERRERFDDALHVLKQGMSHDTPPSNIELRRKGGELSFRLRKLLDARDILSDLRSLDRADVVARYKLALVKRELAFRGEADRSFAEELGALDIEAKRYASDRFLDFERGYIIEFWPSWMKEGKFPDGLELLLSAWRSYSKMEEVAGAVVAALLTRDRLEDACSFMREIEKEGKKHLECRALIASYFLEKGRSEAKTELEKFLNEWPSHPLAVELARLENQEIERADNHLRTVEHIRVLKKAAESGSALAQFRLAYSYMFLGRRLPVPDDPYSAALDLFKQIISSDPAYIPAYGGMKDMALRLQGEIPELIRDSEKYLARGLEENKENPFLLAARGELLDLGFGTKRKKEAVESYERSLKWDYFQPKVHHALGGIHRYLKNNSRASFHYGIVLELSRDGRLLDEARRALNYLQKNR